MLTKRPCVFAVSGLLLGGSQRLLHASLLRAKSASHGALLNRAVPLVKFADFHPFPPRAAESL